MKGSDPEFQIPNSGFKNAACKLFRLIARLEAETIG